MKWTLNRPTIDDKALVAHNPGEKRPAKDRLQDTRGAANDGNARNILNRKRHDSATSRGYQPRRRGHYDSKEDRSPTPEPTGTRVFSPAIRTASIHPPPPRF